MPHQHRSQTRLIVDTSVAIAAVLFVVALCIATMPGRPW
jgi:hypothetical protein